MMIKAAVPRVIRVKPVARPSSYDSKFCQTAEVVCKLGGIDTDVADALGVDVATVNRWKVAHEEFCESLKVGKAPANERVRMALYHRAIGYSHPEDDIRVVNGAIVITPTIKYYPPDTTACIFWAKNRMPDEFRANPEPGEEGYVAPVKIEVSVVDASKPKA